MRLVEYGGGTITEGSMQLHRATGQSVDLRHAPEDMMRTLRGADLSMIFQEPMTSLNPVFTVGSQLTEAIMLHQPGDISEATATAIRILDQVRIPDAKAMMGRYPHELSGGMRQRVMIAMALITKPELLIADEPTTALDVTVQAQILELIKKMQRELGMAVIFITHDLGVVSGLCDRVQVMYGGRIVETADVRTLFYEPRHPYTRALQRSIPSLQPKGAELYTIRGLPPDLSKPLPGCSFAPRCEHVTERCSASRPNLAPLSSAHAQSCLRVQAGEL
jgi:oligopeptide transport system ATP-binding protein